LIYTVTLNPALDIYIEVPHLQVGTVNLAARLRKVWGGKSLNVARTLKSLGAPCAAMGIACGAAGEELVKGVLQEGIEADFVRAGGETRTNVKITDSAAGVTTDVNQIGPFVPQSALDGLWERLRARVREGDVVALCGSLPKGAPEGIYGEWAEKLQALGAVVALDASKAALSRGLSARPDVVKPNLFELSELAGREISSAEDALSACASIAAAGVGLVALSLGKAGALFVTGRERVYVPGVAVKVHSTTGAGDALLAGLLFALNRKEALSDAAAFSVAVSAAHVSTPPGESLSMERVGELLARIRQRMDRAELKDAF